MRSAQAWALAGGVVMMASGPASAAQVSLHEAVLAHDASTESTVYGAVSAAAPANWKTPVDYAAGTLHFRLEVQEKPGATGVTAQVCLQQDGRATGKLACAKDYAFFDKGVYDWSQPVAELQGASGIDWTRKPQELVLLHKDCFGKLVSSKTTDWVGTPFLTLYYPMQAKLSVVAVSPGATFAGWPVSIRRMARAARLEASGLPAWLYRIDGRAFPSPRRIHVPLEP